MIFQAIEKGKFIKLGPLKSADLCQVECVDSVFRGPRDLSSTSSPSLAMKPSDDLHDSGIASLVCCHVQ